MAILLHTPRFFSNYVKSLTSLGSYTDRYGFSATVYQTTNGDGVPYTLALPKDGDTFSGTIDLLGYLKFLISKGVLTGNEYLTGYELGNEPYNGRGYMQVNYLTYIWSFQR